MDPDPLAPIRITDHVRDRLIVRFGSVDVDQVRGEIRVAILEDRFSHTQPPWSKRGIGSISPGRHHDPLVVYVWPEGEDRCYVVARTGDRLLVKTVLFGQREDDDHRLRVGFVRARA